MPFTLHTHSGEFCHHAKDKLEEVIKTAISKGMRVMALTEHMPRDQPEDLYPEEKEKRVTCFDLWRSFADYHEKALKLREKHGHQIHLLIGFELDYIRESSIGLVQKLQEDYKFDMFIGSIHHVNTIPIDFNREMYLEALESSEEKTEESLFEEYFDAQYEMLTKLNPPVVGHFDLIRLLSSDHHRALRSWEGVWAKIERNVDYIVSYGGLFEMNSSSLRKGLPTPYPQREICELIISKGGRFTFSDDSHGMAQVGLNYYKMLSYVESLGMDYVYYLERLPMGQIAVDCLGPCKVRKIGTAELRRDPFFVRLAKELEAEAQMPPPAYPTMAISGNVLF